MKKILVIIAAILLFSGCVGQKTSETVKNGDNVSVDYTGSLTNGKVFDTTNEKIAKENNLSIHDQPLRIVVGKGNVIKGFDEGLIGMKVGESKTLTIPPEKAYGPKNPQMMQTIPIIQKMPTTRIFQKDFQIPINQFNSIFGPTHKIGENVKIPETNVNLTILNITSNNVLVSYNLKIGDEIQLGPWNETIIKIDDKNISTKPEVKKNDIVQIKGVPWNTTVIDIDSENITLRHNNIPDTKIRSGLFSSTRLHFNETYITLDQNNELAGETLIFNIIVRSIN